MGYMNPMYLNTHSEMSVSGAELGPIEQLRIARQNLSASLLGAALGGFVPVATYTVAHQQLLVGAAKWSGVTFVSPAWALVAGGLLYSAKTVWQWGKLTFNDRWKATGFVLLVEGVMVFSPVVWLSRTALGYLVAINAIATACLLAMRDRADTTTRDEREVDEAEPAAMEASCTSTPPSKLLPRQGRVAQTTELSDEALYPQAIALVRSGICSISAVQRSLGVGYNRASRLVERMEREGLVGPQTGGRRLVKVAQLELASAAASREG